ncbi:glycosyltransferase [Oleispirillum naphthae]|uniref:glycosyltransferase n=1 Tax=Oleispirillum naphthae TaxID=2838853 RepID=UPI003082665D
MSAGALPHALGPAEEEVLGLVARQIGEDGRTASVVLGADAGDSLIDALLALAGVESVILSRTGEALSARHGGRFGWLDVSVPEVRLPGRMGRVVHYFVAGAQWNLGSRAACQAWRLGVRTIRFHDVDLGVQDVGVKALLFQEGWKSLIYRLGQTYFVPVLEAMMRRVLRQLQKETDSPAAASAAFRPGRVLFAVGSLGPGGSERQVVNTILGLKARGADDVVLVHQWPMSPPNDFFHEDLARAGVPCRLLEGAGDVRFGPPSDGARRSRLVRRVLLICGGQSNLVLNYLRMFRQERPEVVHAWLDDVNVHAGLAALLAGVPRIVLGCRSLSPDHFPFHQIYMRPLYRVLLENPSVTVLNNSEAGARSYAKWLGVSPGRFRVVRNGFDFPEEEVPAAVSDRLRAELRIPHGATVVGGVMRLSAEKGPGLWIRAAEIVSQRVEDAYFVLVGDGPLGEEIAAQVAASPAQARIRLLGKRRDVRNLFSVMDVLVLTSMGEGLPNVLIEAQAMGVPVAATNVGGVGEIFDDGDTGVFVGGHTPEAVAEGVLEVIGNEGISQRSRRNAPARMREKFSIARMVGETMAAYGRH